MLMWLSLLALIAPPAPRFAAAERTQQESETPEMAEARANRPRVKTPPQLVSGGPVDLPESARAQGAHGVVTIEAVLTRDGKVIQARVELTSRSELLDQFALATAQALTFTPAKDALGNAISMPLTLPFELRNTNVTRQGRGILQYRCDQFVRDEDWWRATWPAKERSQLFYIARGIQAVQSGFKRGDDFEERWGEAIAACRKKPDALFIDIFQPEGATLRRLAKSG